MVYMGSQTGDIGAGTPATFDIDRMPRGGPDASCLDRLLQTDRPEYLDRDSDEDAVNEARKRSVMRALEWTGEFFGNTERFARIVLDEVADVPDPKILELGSGHGGLSRKLLEWHPTAELTVTDIEPRSVKAIEDGDLGEHPRATVREMDATAIDAPTEAFRPCGVRVLVSSPTAAAGVAGVGRRHTGSRQTSDHRLPRPPSPLHLVRLASLPLAPVVPFVHDGVISSLRCYSPSALRALDAYADSGIDVELRGGLMSPQVAVASRGR
jgi:hypothetical protein